MSRIQTRIPSSDVASLRQPTITSVLSQTGVINQSEVIGQCRIQIVSVTGRGDSQHQRRGRKPDQLTEVVAGSLIECQYCLAGFESLRGERGRTDPIRTDFIRTDFIRTDFIRTDFIRAVEHSVLWHTTGKGTRDFVVHFFERRKFAKSGSSVDGTANLERQACLQPYLFRTVCPTSPLTYHGKLLAIDWLVRVRVFLASGQDFSFDQEFVVVAPTNSGKAV